MRSDMLGWWFAGQASRSFRVRRYCISRARRNGARKERRWPKTRTNKLARAFIRHARRVEP